MTTQKPQQQLMKNY